MFAVSALVLLLFTNQVNNLSVNNTSNSSEICQKPNEYENKCLGKHSFRCDYETCTTNETICENFKTLKKSAKIDLTLFVFQTKIYEFGLYLKKIMEKILEEYEKKIEKANQSNIVLENTLNNLKQYSIQLKNEYDKLKSKLTLYNVPRSEVISVNIGGKIFSTFKSTLNKRIKKPNSDNNEYYDPHLLQILISVVTLLEPLKFLKTIFFQHKVTLTQHQLVLLHIQQPILPLKK